MIRFVTLAAVAAFAATSANAQDVRVSLVGKSAEQVQADILSASRSVCHKEYSVTPLEVGAYGRCVRDVVKSANAKLAA